MLKSKEDALIIAAKIVVTILPAMLSVDAVHLIFFRDVVSVRFSCSLMVPGLLCLFDGLVVDRNQ